MYSPITNCWDWVIFKYRKKPKIIKNHLANPICNNRTILQPQICLLGKRGEKSVFGSISTEKDRYGMQIANQSRAKTSSVVFIEKK